MTIPTELSEEQRINKAKNYFRCKQNTAFRDSNATELLYKFDNIKLQDLDEFDYETHGPALAKLTASNLFEIGANSIYITEIGMTIIYRLKSGDMEIRPDTYTTKHKLNMVNDWFRRKAAEVFLHEPSLILISKLYEDIFIENTCFDYETNTIALAKLTAAGFCSINDNCMHLTPQGHQFIESIINDSNLKESI